MAKAMHRKQEELAQPFPTFNYGGTWVVGTPVAPSQQDPSSRVPVEYYIPSSSQTTNPISAAKYTAAPPQPIAAQVAPWVPNNATTNNNLRGNSNSNPNPYVQVSPVPPSASKTPGDTICKLLNRCGHKLEHTARKAGDAAGNVWNHLKTGPTLTTAAMAMLAQGTKVIAEGGHEKLFQQMFSTMPGERLQNSYTCYLSTSAGPVLGTLYITTTRLAFCSENPLCNNIAPGQQEWVYYKVAVQLHQLKAVNPSLNTRNPSEKYIQVVTADNHEFWFMGLVSYDKALKHLTGVLQRSELYHSQNPSKRT